MHKEEKEKANLEPSQQVRQNAPSGPVADCMLENGRPVGNRSRCLPFCGTPRSFAILDQHPLANENEAPNVTNADSPMDRLF